MPCEVCGKDVAIGEWPFCPHGEVGGYAQHGDECDMWIENMGPHPEHFRSKAEWKRTMKERGLRLAETHRPHPGDPKKTDTCPNYPDPYTMENVRILMERAFKQPGEPTQERPLMIPDIHTLTDEEKKVYLP